MANPTNELAEAVEALLLTLEGFVATCDGAVKNGDPCLNFATFEVGNKLYCAEHARLVSDETPLVESDFGVKVRRVRALLAQVKGGGLNEHLSHGPRAPDARHRHARLGDEASQGALEQGKGGRHTLRGDVGGALRPGGNHVARVDCTTREGGLIDDRL